MKGINPKAKIYFPYWYNKIRHALPNKLEMVQCLIYRDKLHHSISLFECDTCVIGEIHNWTNDYNDMDEEGNDGPEYCGTCACLCDEIYRMCNPKTAGVFVRKLNDTVTHIEEDHPEIVARCSNGGVIPSK